MPFQVTGSGTSVFAKSSHRNVCVRSGRKSVRLAGESWNAGWVNPYPQAIITAGPKFC